MESKLLKYVAGMDDSTVRLLAKHGTHAADLVREE